MPEHATDLGDQGPIARGYEVTVDVWGPGVLHPRPTLNFHIPKLDVSFTIADDFDQLLAILDKLTERVKERKEQWIKEQEMIKGTTGCSTSPSVGGTVWD